MHKVDLEREQARAKREGAERDAAMRKRVYEEQRPTIEERRAMLAARGIAVGKDSIDKRTTELHVWVAIEVSGDKATQEEALEAGAVDIDRRGRWIFCWPCEECRTAEETGGGPT